MLFWYLVISSTRRLSSFSLLSSYLNLYLLFSSTFQLSTLFGIRDTLSTSSPTKKKETL